MIFIFNSILSGNELNNNLNRLTWFNINDNIKDEIKPHVNSAGESLVQLYQRIPYGKYLYTSFEINYDSHASVEFTKNHMMCPVIIVCIYMATVYLGNKYMNNLVRMDLRYTLAYWNAGLSIFSFMGALRTVPELLYRIGSENNLGDTICRNPSKSWGVGPTGFWCSLFVFSKIPELLDTYFIVVRKRPLLFLHWYHHVTVLLYCWHSYATRAPQALYFVSMNYTVHSIMYGYYYLMACKLKPPWLSPVVITAAQIIQMFVGMSVQVAASYKYFTDSNSCDMNGTNIFWGGIMYASYLALFTKFAINRYSKQSVKKLK